MLQGDDVLIAVVRQVCGGESDYLIRKLGFKAQSLYISLQRRLRRDVVHARNGRKDAPPEIHRGDRRGHALVDRNSC